MSNSTLHTEGLCDLSNPISMYDMVRKISVSSSESIIRQFVISSALGPNILAETWV